MTPTPTRRQLPEPTTSLLCQMLAMRPDLKRKFFAEVKSGKPDVEAWVRRLQEFRSQLN